MTKSDYMGILSQKLRRLPKEDFDRAMEYFEEYFEDAGPENEKQAIENLGSPEEAANELIMDLAVKNVKEPPRTVKKGLSALWIGILGVCAAPIALPLGFAFVIVLLALVFTALVLIFCLFLSAAAIAASGIIGVVGGAILLVSSFGDGLATMGTSLCALGIGLASVYGSFLFCRWFLKKSSKALGKITKGGKKHENNR
jgi:uncharacterized membrane protein